MPVKAVVMPTGEEPQEEVKGSPEERVEEVVKKVVKSLGEKIEFECLESGRGYQLSPEFVQKWLRPSWALVYHQLQGRTMERALELHDLTHPRLTTTHVLVALSRARSASRVWPAP